MKVIVAGLNKTGTTTITAALKQLPGFDVIYHYMEHYGKCGKEWEQICETGEKKEVLHHLYKDVDAVADIPAAYFWEELLEAFPEAKVSN